MVQKFCFEENCLRGIRRLMFSLLISSISSWFKSFALKEPNVLPGRELWHFMHGLVFLILLSRLLPQFDLCNLLLQSLQLGGSEVAVGHARAVLGLAQEVLGRVDHLRQSFQGFGSVGVLPNSGKEGGAKFL